MLAGDCYKQVSGIAIRAVTNATYGRNIAVMRTT